MTNMTDEERDLIERLNSMYSHRGDGIPTQHVNPDGPAAAACLAALIEERDHAQTSASRDVMNERRRQSEEEGFSPEHDDGYTEGQLPGAGACYALWDVKHWAARLALKNFWPWSIDWWKPGDRRQNLVKAGALIIAEIERLDRAALQPKDADHG